MAIILSLFSPFVGHIEWVTLCGSHCVGHIEWVTLSGSYCVGHIVLCQVCQTCVIPVSFVCKFNKCDNFDI